MTEPSKIELWHCKSARSLRALWTLEELGLPYELHLLPFPPRFKSPEYLEINPLGTIPYLRDGALEMNESGAICQYLASRYGDGSLVYQPDEPGYGEWLNWLHQSDTLYTFPQTLILRYRFFEAKERRQPQVADDYSQWTMSRVRLINARVEQHEFLTDRFTIADIAVGYALHLGEFTGIKSYYKPATLAYLERLKARPAFQRANAPGEPSMRMAE